MYDEGHGVAKDYKKALEWYGKAAAQGNTGAQHNLGIMYQYGQGVDRNFVKAFKWYLKSDKLLK